MPKSWLTCSWVSGLAKTLGSNVGVEPIASTSPLRGSRATKAPLLAGLPLAWASAMPVCSALSPVFCRAASSVSFRSWPWTGSVWGRLASRMIFQPPSAWRCATTRNFWYCVPGIGPPGLVTAMLCRR